MHLEHKVQGVVNKGDHVILKLSIKDQEVEMEADYCLVAVGETLYRLKPRKAGLKVNERGQVEINENMQTSVSNIYAIGDVVRALCWLIRLKRRAYMAEFLAGQKPILITT